MSSSLDRMAAQKVEMADPSILKYRSKIKSDINEVYPMP